MTYPTYNDLVLLAERQGYEIDRADGCGMQGVLIGYSRPVRTGETFLGLPVAGPRVEHEVIERHYTPELDATDEVMDVTWGRAIQRVIWEIEMSARERSAASS